MSELQTIYLQGEDATTRFEFYDDATWCQDKLNDDDVEYILKSEYDALQVKLARMVGLFNRMQRRLEGSIDYVEAGSSARGTKMYLALSAISEIVEEALAEPDEMEKET